MDKNVKKMTMVAMMCAIAYAVMALVKVPLVFPGVSFLKYEPKDVVITLGGLIWGPQTACLMSVVVSFIEMFTVSDTGIIGFVMNVISTCSFACTAAFIYKKKRTLAGAVIGLVAGSIAMICAMMLWNYLITPLYMGYPREAVAKLLLPAFLPYNALKAGLNTGFTYLLYKPVITMLRKAGYVETAPAGGAGGKKKINVGLLLVAAGIVVTCVLIILSMNKII